MRVSREEKERSHERILESASRMFRAQGVDGPSVAEIMTAAGMTHGGFYRHFDTREDLLAAALAAAFDQFLSVLDGRIRDQGAVASVAALKSLYLSDGHVAHPELGCPLPALGGDVARGSDELKAVFGAGLDRVVTAMAAGLQGSEAERREQALRDIAMMAGAVMLARASDAQTGKDILAACR